LHHGHSDVFERPCQQRVAYVGIQPWMSLIVDTRLCRGSDLTWVHSACKLVCSNFEVDSPCDLVKYDNVMSYEKVAKISELNCKMILWE